jgi:hypothetical protein
MNASSERVSFPTPAASPNVHCSSCCELAYRHGALCGRHAAPTRRIVTTTASSSTCLFPRALMIFIQVILAVSAEMLIGPSSYSVHICALVARSTSNKRRCIFLIFRPIPALSGVYTPLVKMWSEWVGI